MYLPPARSPVTRQISELNPGDWVEFEAVAGGSMGRWVDGVDGRPGAPRGIEACAAGNWRGPFFLLQRRVLAAGGLEGINSFQSPMETMEGLFVMLRRFENVGRGSKGKQVITFEP